MLQIIFVWVDSLIDSCNDDDDILGLEYVCYSYIKLLILSNRFIHIIYIHTGVDADTVQKELESSTTTSSTAAAARGH